MSLGACIYSTNVIPWEEFSEFVFSLQSELSDVTIDLAAGYPEVGLYKNREWALIVLHDQTNDRELLLEEMSRLRGIEQKTLLIIDMKPLDLAQRFAKAFARRYPCLFQFGDTIQDNKELLAE